MKLAAIVAFVIAWFSWGIWYIVTKERFTKVAPIGYKVPLWAHIACIPLLILCFFIGILFNPKEAVVLIFNKVIAILKKIGNFCKKFFTN